MLKQINYFIQLFWVLALLVLLAIQFSNFKDRFDEYIIVYLILAFFLGLNHVISSIIHVFKHKESSVLRYHLLATMVLFFSWIFIGLTDLVKYFDQLEMEEVMVVFWVPPAALAIYFWYITFTKLSIIQNTDHSYLDL